MSDNIFNNGDNQTTEEKPVVQEQPQQEQAPKQEEKTDSPFLVYGERKFNSDAEVVDKITNQDAFIEQLKKENEQLRQMQEQSTRTEELMELLKQKEQGTTQAEGESTAPQLDPNQLEGIVESLLQKKQVQSAREKNLSEVDSAFKETYGEKAGEVYQSRIKENGLTNEMAVELAATSPEAFKKLMLTDGTNQQQKRPSAASEGVNTASLASQPQEKQPVHKMKGKEKHAEIARRIQEKAKQMGYYV